MIAGLGSYLYAAGMNSLAIPRLVKDRICGGERIHSSHLTTDPNPRIHSRDPGYG